MRASKAGPAQKPVGGQAAGAGWDAFRPARPLQTLWVSLAVLCAVPGLAATTLRVFPPTDDIPALFASFISYAVLAYLLAAVFFGVALLRARRRAPLAVLTVISLCLLACHVAWLAPFFVSDHRDATTPPFTMLSLNTRNGSADPAQLAAQGQQVDLVVLLEATDQITNRLQPYGWKKRFPYSVGVVYGPEGNTLIYSRFPLTRTTPIVGSTYQQWVTTVTVPGLGAVRLVAGHPCNPFCGSNRFRSDHQLLRAAADANLGGPLIVAGDLNAVDDHAPIRALHRDGLESVTDILGAGWLPTYPANLAVPPLLPIDHVLVNHFLTATSVERVRIAGTDHLGLVAQIAGAR